MLRIALLVLAVFAQSGDSATTGNAALAPLWLYQGAWHVNRSGSQKPDQLVNQCAELGHYFACQQTVNGVSGNLLVIVPTGQHGKYHTQVIEPSGSATGLSDLSIEGDRWSFSSRWNQGDKITYYRTINVFSGKNRIHFEQDESPDGKSWTTKNSGDEVRAAGR
ncbi:MAG TPA: hypothetical protein VHZ07_05350 [Bryobacteraceae bacterium]|nr:hypothetical protein [Bryobacteraceae bacterium]